MGVTRAEETRSQGTWWGRCGLYPPDGEFVGIPGPRITGGEGEVQPFRGRGLGLLEALIVRLSSPGVQRPLRAGSLRSPHPQRLIARSCSGFAELMKRVFRLDVWRCANCGSEGRWIAVITSAEVIVKILKHLELPRVLIGPAPPLAVWYGVETQRHDLQVMPAAPATPSGT